jgi:hypothetical protein
MQMHVLNNLFKEEKTEKLFHTTTQFMRGKSNTKAV